MVLPEKNTDMFLIAALQPPGESISRLESMAMANATNIAKFENNLNTKLEEVMQEVLQASLAVGETKAAVETVSSRHLLPWLFCVPDMH